MSSRSWTVLSRHAARLASSRFAKPAARILAAAGGLLLLALVGRSAAGAIGGLSPPPPSSASSASGFIAATPPPPTSSASGSELAPTPTEATPSGPAVPHAPASPEDPVTLNTATFEDLRRLPGIGAKRANAILALRTHLGRFRSLDDLLKVKGIGRAMLRRLRPLVRVDPSAPLDGGLAALP